jgi:hypothetical protein
MPEKVMVTIFSRDRAMQLDGTLKSFFRHCSDPDYALITILYKTTNDYHKNQYRILENEYRELGVIFIEETFFEKDFLQIIFQFTRIPLMPGRLCFSVLHFFHKITGKFYFGYNPKGYVLFVVDDTIFVRPFTLQEVCNILEKNPDAIGFSLRLGRNTTFCYTLNRPQVEPDYMLLEESILKFKWPVSDADFGYPLEVSSSMYRIPDLLPLLSIISFKNPNKLEEKMSIHAKEFAKDKPILLCFNQTVAFSNPVNRVQKVYPNHAGVKISQTSEELASLFDNNYRIQVENFDYYSPTGCHQEVPLDFKKRRIL